MAWLVITVTQAIKAKPYTVSVALYISCTSAAAK